MGEVFRLRGWVDHRELGTQEKLPDDQLHRHTLHIGLEPLGAFLHVIEPGYRIVEVDHLSELIDAQLMVLH